MRSALDRSHWTCGRLCQAEQNTVYFVYFEDNMGSAPEQERVLGVGLQDLPHGAQLRPLLARGRVLVRAARAEPRGRVVAARLQLVGLLGCAQRAGGCRAGERGAARR
jgi:hypothetical protein